MQEKIWVWGGADWYSVQRHDYEMKTPTSDLYMEAVREGMDMELKSPVENDGALLEFAAASLEAKGRIRADEREKCIRDICPCCREGWKLVHDINGRHIWHKWTHPGAGPCQAASIRDRGYQEKGAK